MAQAERKALVSVLVQPGLLDTPQAVTTLDPARLPRGDDRFEQSPLWMVTAEPSLNEFVTDLQRLRRDIMREPAVERELRFSKAGLEEVRAAFARMIRHGEEALHRLSQVLCATFLSGVQLQSVVIGEVETTRERFTLSQSISPADLYSTLDIDLGTRQLGKLQFTLQKLH